MTLPPTPSGLPHWTWAEMADRLRVQIVHAHNQIQRINANPALRNSEWGRQSISTWNQQLQQWQNGLRTIRAADHTVGTGEGAVATLAGSGAEATATAATATGSTLAGEAGTGAAGVTAAGVGIAAAVTLAAVIRIVLVGLALNRQQRDILDQTRDLPPGAEPADIFIGPPASGACYEQAMLENGLIWTDQGWRAPLTLPEPQLNGDAGAGGDEEQYLKNIEDWHSALTFRVDNSLADAEGSCGNAVSGRGCTEVVSRATVWKPEWGSPDSYVILSSEGPLEAAVWQWQRGGFTPDDVETDVLVARLSGEPGTAVCVANRAIGYDEALVILEAAGVDEETRRAVNTGCYWEIGIETENGLKSSDADFENILQGQIGTDGSLDLLFAELSCGIGKPAHTLLNLEISTEAGATLAPR